MPDLANGPICAECHMKLGRVGELHPYEFCALYKAGIDPLTFIRHVNLAFGFVKPNVLPTRLPLASAVKWTATEEEARRA